MLNAILEKMALSVISRRAADKVQDEMAASLADSREKLLRRFVYDILQGNLSVDEDEDGINAAYQTHFSNGRFRAIAVKCDFGRLSSGLDSIHAKIDGITRMLELFFEADCNECIAFAHGVWILCVINYESESQKFETLYHEISGLFNQYEGTYITIGISSTTYSLSRLGRCLFEAMEAVRYRIALGRGRLIYFSSAIPGEQTGEHLLCDNLRQRLTGSVETMEEDAFSVVLEECFQQLRGKGNENPALWLSLCREIFNEYVTSLARAGLSEVREVLNPGFMEVLDESNSFIELKRDFKAFLTNHLVKYIQEKRSQDSKPIRIAKEYISRHYMAPLSLGDIAEMVHLSPVYFSSIFKKETGQTFSDYLIDCRLEAAKKLLRETDMSVLEISESIGYAGAKYFSKLFRNVVGLTPSEYRRLYAV